MYCSLKNVEEFDLLSIEGGFSNYKFINITRLFFVFFFIFRIRIRIRTNFFFFIYFTLMLYFWPHLAFLTFLSHCNIDKIPL